jgi:hypothetical protein
MADFRTQRMPVRWAEMNVVLRREMEKLYSASGNPELAAQNLQREIDAILSRP